MLVARVERITPRRRGAVLLSFVFLLGSAVGCTYLKWRRERRERLAELQENPGLVLAREAAPENCFALIGKITLAPGQPRQVLAAAFDHDGAAHDLVASREVIAANGFYGLFLPAGNYDLALLADLDGDGFYETGEVVGTTPADAPVRVGAAQSADRFVVQSPEIVFDVARPTLARSAVRVQVHRKPFVVTSVEDPLFAPENGRLGVYHPNQFLSLVQSFFFFLKEPDPKRPIVLLVHGLQGTPRDFEPLIASIDQSKYQVLLFYYPSGLPIEKMGATLAFALRQVARDDPGRLRVALVAHSLGGLVSRRALNELCASGRPPWLRAYASFDTPYGGDESAAKGVRAEMDMVASWQDVAAGGPFLKKLFATPLPKDLPFYLFFGWGSDDGSGPSPAGDGTIPLRSQLDPRVQAEATRLLGFEDSHVGILGNGAALKELERMLDETSR